MSYLHTLPLRLAYCFSLELSARLSINKNRRSFSSVTSLIYGLNTSLEMVLIQGLTITSRVYFCLSLSRLVGTMSPGLVSYFLLLLELLRLTERSMALCMASSSTLSLLLSIHSSTKLWSGTSTFSRAISTNYLLMPSCSNRSEI